MPVELDNIDDLEALLNSLSADELASLDALDEPGDLPSDDELASLDDLEDNVVTAPEPEKKPRATRKRKLKPLADDEPVATANEVLAEAQANAPLTDDEVNGELSPEDMASLEYVNLSTEPKPEPKPETASEKVARIAAEKEARFKAEDAEAEAALIAGVEGKASDEDDDLNSLLDAASELSVTGGAVSNTSVMVEPDPVEVVAPSRALSAGTAYASTAGARTIRPVFDPSGTLKTFIDPDRLQDDLNFTTTNISMAMTRQAALFAHYSNLAAQASYQHDRAKQQVDLLCANLDQQIRDDLLTAGTKFTEKVIESFITKDSTYQAAQIRAHEAKAIAKMVETAADSFRHRKDMLIQVGADLRQEKQGNLSMREHPGVAATRDMRAS